VHADIFHAGITMENVLPNVQINFHLSNWIGYASGEGEEIGREAVPWWKDAISLNSAVNALRSLASQDFTCTERERKDTPARELCLFFDSEGVCLEDQASYMKTLGPAFRRLHEKGFSTCFFYTDEILQMYFTLEEDAWNWTATEWMVRLRTENQYAESWIWAAILIPRVRRNLQH
jgi:hypothetical protein